MKQFTKHFVLVAAIILCGTMNVWADNVSYVYYTLDGNKPVKHTGEKVDPIPLDNSFNAIGSVDGTWYVVNGKVTITHRIEVSSHAHIILADNCELICEKGITVMEACYLNIYGQSRNNGYLQVTSPEPGNAGIGGECRVQPDEEDTPNDRWNCGEVNIHGGYLDVHGSDWSAGIGGGWMQRSCKVTMYGGLVEAYGGQDGAGIGSGCFNQRYEKAYLGEDTGWTKIYGGSVIAYGGYSGAGIGGGSCRYVGKIEIFGEEGGFTYVEAHGGSFGAGIGGGSEMEGSLKGGTNTGIFIHGGTVLAYGGYNGAGIGGGGIGDNDIGEHTFQPKGADGGEITITGGTVKAYSGDESAGIGGSFMAGLRKLDISGGYIEAYGGTPTSTDCGAGIGSGLNPIDRSVTVNISGGTVIARGYDGAAGIGLGKRTLTPLKYNILDDNSNDVYVTVSGGTVEAYGNGDGAGIGGAYNMSKGGSFTITGGTVIAQAGSECNGEEAGQGSAIGCGTSISNKSDPDICGTYSIGDGIMMHAGSSSSDNRQFTYDERKDGCIWRSYVKLEPCTKHQMVYRVFDKYSHDAKCNYCSHTERETHTFAAGKCVCGYIHDSEFCEVRLYRKNEGADVTYNTAPYDAETNPAGYKSYYKYMFSELELPACEQESFEAIFDGWQALDGTTTLPTSCIEGDGEKLYEEGRLLYVPNYPILYVCARYKPTYEEVGWNWASDNSAATVTLRNRITGSEVDVPATVTKTPILEEIEEEEGQEPVYSYYRFYYAVAPYGDVDYVDVKEEIFDNLFFLTEEDDNIEIITLKKDVANQDVELEDRVFRKDGTWNTLCLPFAVDNFTGTPLEGATVKTLCKSTFDKNNGTLTLCFSNDLHAIEAGKPYIVMWEKPSAYIPYNGENEETTTDLVSPTFRGVKVTVTEAGKMGGTAADFVGQFAPRNFYGADKTVLYFGSDNQLVNPEPFTVPAPNDENVRLFIFPYINAQRGYFQLKDTLASDPSMIQDIVLTFDGIATGIDETIGQSADVWYDLGGRKLNSKPKAKGIYINNGKKVVIK